jgi:lipoprotein-anchoring transpeptidase ErfK/SrfK
VLTRSAAAATQAAEVEHEMGSHRAQRQAERQGVLMRWLPVLAAIVIVIGIGVVVSQFHGPRPVLAEPTTSNPAAPLQGRASASSAPGRPSTPAAPPRSTGPAPPSPCHTNADPQRIIVSVRQQHAWMCTGARQVADSAVTTGATAAGNGTPLGTWHVEAKQTNTTLTVLTGEAYHVAYWLPYNGNVYGLHDSSWQTFPYGSPQYRSGGSHGCVHMPLASMRWLYGWARVGATVTIQA